MPEPLEKWYTVWTKEWEIAGLYHFMREENKENCLKERNVAGKCSVIAEGLLLYEAFSCIIFILK